MIPFTYLEPASLDEALALLAQHGEAAKLIAGGTGLVNLMKQRLARPAFVIGLRALKPLAGISADGALKIGALATLQSLATSAAVRQAAPLLAEACGHVATVRVRSMATLGGAMAHADPNLDTPPALIALDAQIVARSKRGERRIPVDRLFTGYYQTVLEPDEIVTEIAIPAQPAGSGTAFLKFLPATQDDYATVSVAARLALDGNGAIRDARVALGAAAMVPVRAAAVEAALAGKAADDKTFAAAAALVLGAIDPIADFRGSADYKRKMAVVHVRRALAAAAAKAKRPA
ncbi:MAG TPA: xanthine dehydrogenase family protein subunit M [Stellaceae bacterium]|nr:xanthine dehydrogenase family protein subunit M [Stellaceae bacterium]